MEHPNRLLLSVAFQADRDLVTALDNVAQQEGGSRSDAIRKLLRLGLDRYQRRERIVDALEAVQEVAV